MNSEGKLPPLLQDEDKQRRREYTYTKPRKQEKKIAKEIGGRRQPGSGAFSMHKGDVRRDDKGFPLLIECKRTAGNKSIRIELSYLTKITNEALNAGKYPALAIQFDKRVVESVARSRNETAASEDWIAIPLSTFKAMLEALGEEGLGL